MTNYPYTFPYVDPSTGKVERVHADLLEQRPTLSVAQTDDLKADMPEVGVRVWLARTGIEDGEPYARRVSVERLEDGRWVTVDEYDGDNPYDRD